MTKATVLAGGFPCKTENHSCCANALVIFKVIISYIGNKKLTLPNASHKRIIERDEQKSTDVHEKKKVSYA